MNPINAEAELEINYAGQGWFALTKRLFVPAVPEAGTRFRFVGCKNATKMGWLTLQGVYWTEIHDGNFILRLMFDWMCDTEEEARRAIHTLELAGWAVVGRSEAESAP